MSRVVLSGAGGFLGWHVRLRNFANTQHDADAVSLGDGFVQDVVSAQVSGAERVIHLAGANRGSEDYVHDTNIVLAEQLAQSLRAAAVPPKMLVYSNSTHSGTNSAYGVSKVEAAKILARACADVGTEFIDVVIPNVFGEGGRPFYNSVVATFAYSLSRGEPVSVTEDKELRLVHSQVVAEYLLTVSAANDDPAFPVKAIQVSELAELLHGFSDCYSRAEIPDLRDPFTRQLFNTYQSFSFESRPTLELTKRSDSRGVLVELAKSYGGEGQSFVSTSAPGVVRGEHFHLRKIERFVVLSGVADIQIRKTFTDEVREIRVKGDKPVAVDMPIGWTHNIRNVDSRNDLLTMFWVNEVFDPDDTDTYQLKV